MYYVYFLRGFTVGWFVSILVASYWFIFMLPKLFSMGLPMPPLSSYLLGHVPKIEEGHLYKYVYKVWHECGPVFQLWLVNFRVVYVTDVEDIQFCLTKLKLPKHEYAYGIFAYFIGGGLITAGGETHAKHRRAISKTFHAGFLRRLHHHLSLEIETLISVLDEAAKGKEPVDFDAIMLSFAIDVTSRVAFGYAFGSLQNSNSIMIRRMQECLKGVNRLLSLGFLGRFTNEKQKLLNLRAKIAECAKYIIHIRRSESAEDREARVEDILDVLLSTSDDEDYIVDEMITFFLAGTDTTAHAIAFTLLELLKSPKDLDDVVREVDTTIGPGKALPDYEQVKSMTYTESAFREALRIHPTAGASGMVRASDSDVVLPSGHILPKNVMMSIPFYVVHRDPKLWPEPHTFKPERFRSNVRRHPCALLTFSLGSRNCLGQFFAAHEGVTALATMLHRYTFTLACNPSDIDEIDALTMKPRLFNNDQNVGLPVYVKRRL